jgi:hypothetical protein
MLEKTLMLKDSCQPAGVAFSILVTGSRVPAFKTIESRRPKIFNVSAIADFAVPSCVMSHWIERREGDASDESSVVFVRERTTTFALYVASRALTIPRPS